MTDETRIQDPKHSLRIPAPLLCCFTLLDESQRPGSQPSPDSTPSASPGRSSTLIGCRSRQLPGRAMLWFTRLLQMPGTAPGIPSTACPCLGLWLVPINTLTPSAMGFPDSSVGLNLQPAAGLLPSPARLHQHHSLQPNTRMLLLNFPVFLPWDSVFPSCIPQIKPVAAASPRTNAMSFPILI